MTTVGVDELDRLVTTSPPAVVVLLVEDEESFVEALSLGLKREGFRVVVARDGLEALERFDDTQPDLILLDVKLPGISGLDVCREIRTRSRVPIVMVSARTSEIDTVVGLEVGADDYISKPYRLRELIARIRAVLRRSPRRMDARDDDETLEAGDVVINRQRHEVVVRGDLCDLPLKEFELLELLVSNTGRVLTRDTLIERVWGDYYVGDTKTLDVHINRLRARIEEDPSRPRAIRTIRGIGYMFERTPDPTVLSK